LKVRYTKILKDNNQEPKIRFTHNSKATKSNEPVLNFAAG